MPLLSSTSTATSVSFLVTPVDTRKLYRRVADTIMASIESGDYQRGARLPSERDLAASFKFSRPTIREAMIALEIRGVVEARQGSGIYVTDHARALIIHAVVFPSGAMRSHLIHNAPAMSSVSHWSSR